MRDNERRELEIYMALVICIVICSALYHFGTITAAQDKVFKIRRVLNADLMHFVSKLKLLVNNDDWIVALCWLESN